MLTSKNKKGTPVPVDESDIHHIVPQECPSHSDGMLLKNCSSCYILMNNQLWLYCFETYLETTIRKQIILEIIKCLNKTMPANICICKKRDVPIHFIEHFW